MSCCSTLTIIFGIILESGQKFLLYFTESESEVAQSCPTLCNPMCCSLPGSSIHRIFQARVLEWVPFPSLGDLPDLGIEPRSPTLQADTLPSEPPGKPLIRYMICKYFLPYRRLLYHFVDKQKLSRSPAFS